MIGLKHKELVDLGSLSYEEASYLLCLGIPSKELLILTLLAMLWVVAH